MTHSEYRTYEANVKAFFAREGIENLSLESEDEGTFSWRNCECCNRQLGGTRYDAKGYHRATKQVFEYVVCSDCVYYAEYGQLDDTTMMDMLCDCGHVPAPSGHTPGYGQDVDGKTLCYACCADRDKAQMIADGKTILYLQDPTARAGSFPLGVYTVSNWYESLTFPVGRVKVGRHNIAGKRYDFWFKGPDGATWHGVNYGDNTQIAYCRRTKG